MIETEAMSSIPEAVCKTCKYFKDVNNPIYGWCMAFKADVHPEWRVRCSGYVRKD